MEECFMKMFSLLLVFVMLFGFAVSCSKEVKPTPEEKEEEIRDDNSVTPVVSGRVAFGSPSGGAADSWNELFFYERDGERTFIMNRYTETGGFGNRTKGVLTGSVSGTWTEVSAARNYVKMENLTGAGLAGFMANRIRHGWSVQYTGPTLASATGFSWFRGNYSVPANNNVRSAGINAEAVYIMSP
jgi:hypothetical protein